MPRPLSPALALLIALLGTALPLSVLAHDAAAESPATSPATCAAATLCARLGGPPALNDIASALVERSSTDPRTRAHWDRVDLKRVRIKLGEYLCVVTGGDCRFDDDDLRTIHAGHHIHSGAFYAIVEDLRAILDARGVAAREKNELLALLAPAKREVVEP